MVDFDGDDVVSLNQEGPGVHVGPRVGAADRVGKLICGFAARRRGAGGRVGGGVVRLRIEKEAVDELAVDPDDAAVIDEVANADRAGGRIARKGEVLAEVEIGRASCRERVFVGV